MFSVKSSLFKKDGVKFYSAEYLCNETEVNYYKEKCRYNIPIDEVRFIDIIGYISFLKHTNIITEEQSKNEEFIHSTYIRLMNEELQRMNELDGGKRQFSITVSPVKILREELTIENLV